MKTARLYYNDSYLLEFDASIIESRPVGEQVGIVLDRTAFYPTSGGQLNDLGSINGVDLVDCFEEENTGAVVHVLRERVSGEAVHGKVDFARRRDHMQQHSGQHILSQAFVELFGWPTVSFHMGATTCTIDLPADAVSQEQASEAEALANRLVQENREVAVKYIPADKIAEAGLRKATERSGEIRVIDVSGYDRSACGGTHVRRTGEIGPILITGLDRAKKQTRVEFICGGRVLGFARRANRILESISQTVSTPPMDAAVAVRGIWDDLQRSRKQIDELESKLLDYEAASFPVIGGIAAGSFENRGLDRIKLLASKICARPNVVALLADQSDQLRVVFARSADSQVDCAGVLKKIVDRFGGRGGGRPQLAQGGLAAGSAEEVLKAAADLVR